MHPASHVRRILAVFIDFWVLFGVWIAVGIVFKNGIGIALFFLIDIVLTAVSGQSIGRLVTRIRVARIQDGASPGLVRAMARIAIVTTTGWVFPFASMGPGAYGYRLPERFWWDSAVGTILVRAD